jgi:malate dehydrogenase (oxaloacetate-decarboxylating)
MHDDQHGTAIVVLAGLMNAAKVVRKNIQDMKIVLVGAGAAGVAVAKLLYLYAKPTIVVVDSKGIIEPTRTDLNQEKVLLMSYSQQQKKGTLNDALAGADVFIGLSKCGLLTPEMIKSMASNPIIFALANPTPEIMPQDALSAGAAVVATGRSDFPNQVNNALGFPGIFRGALDHGVNAITDDHKIAAAKALANLIEEPRSEYIIPSPFDAGVVDAVASTIR